MFLFIKRIVIHIKFSNMAHHGVGSDTDSTDASKSAVAAVVAMLHAEHDRSPDNCSGATSQKLSHTSLEQRLPHQRIAHTTVAAEARTGNAIRAELDLEVLTVKRRRLVELSREVLEARCPGFCSRASLTEDEYLREASCALAGISNDVEEAALASQAQAAFNKCTDAPKNP